MVMVVPFRRRCRGARVARLLRTVRPRGLQVVARSGVRTGSVLDTSAGDQGGALVDSRAVRTFRVFVVVTAVVAIALGIVAIVWPRPSLVLVALLFGVYLVVAGALRVFAAVRGHGTRPVWRWTSGIVGGLVAVAGLVTLLDPAIPLVVYAVLAGVGFLIEGSPRSSAASSATRVRHASRPSSAACCRSSGASSCSSRPDSRSPSSWSSRASRSSSSGPRPCCSCRRGPPSAGSRGAPPSAARPTRCRRAARVRR